jgi:hypothetical protein
VSSVTSPHRLTDERLAWLAAKPYCEQHARKAGSRGSLAGILFPRGLGTAVLRSERYTNTMADYSFAVDDVSRKLTADERAALRAANVLPAWFLPAIDRRFNDLRAQRKG